MGKGSESSGADAAPEINGRNNFQLRLPKTDQRCSYRLLDLDNGCKVTLISDPETDKVRVCFCLSWNSGHRAY